MKSFDKLILLVCAVMVGIGLLFNTALPLIVRDDERLYVVEINRFMADGHTESVIIERSDALLNMNFFSVNEDEEVLHDMFARNSRHYVVRPHIVNGELQGFFQFNLAPLQNDSLSNLRAFVNGIIAFVAVLVLVVLLYIKYQIIVPFNEISHLPTQLAKGNVNKGIPESKSRYFGNFIWGLNMMRETLSVHKTREMELLKEKKTMILSISHDINTPLSAIKLSTKALSSGLYTDTSKQQEVLEQIIRKTVEIEKFVADIIKISKEDLLTFEVKKEEFYLADIIDRIVADYEEILVLQKTELLVDSFSNRLLLGDSERLVEVFQNLMENAIKYGDGKQVGISFDNEEDFQLVTVANTGNSLSEGEVIHVFDSFWRGSNVGGAAGSGLGLYICRQLMRQMGGDIYAQVVDDTFCVTVVI